MIANVRNTKHTETERIDRLTQIAIIIGFGKEYMSYTDTDNDKRYVLTDTGVLMVYGNTNTQLITAFVPKLQYVKKYFVVLPFALELIIRNNQKKGYFNL